MTIEDHATVSAGQRTGLSRLRDYLRAREISILLAGGVAVLVLIIVLGAITAVVGIRTIAAGYARQQSYAAIVQTATAIDENLLRLRIAASDYLVSGRSADRNRMIDAGQALTARVDAGSLALREVGFGEIVDALRSRLDLQRGVVETLGDLRDRRNRLTDEFVTVGNAALAQLDEIVPRAFEFGDFEGSNRALRLRENLLQAQGNVLVWLLARARAPIGSLGEQWTELNANVRRLQLTLREPRDREAVAQVRAKLEPQSALVEQLGVVSQDESQLDRILDQENGLVQSLSDQLRARARQSEDVFIRGVDETLDQARLWTILLAGLSVGLGALGGWYMFHRTVQPIRRITHTLGALASGKLETPVPFAGARHELGQMAHAADVFKNAMVEVERSRQVFQTVIDNLPDGVLLYDENLRTLMWSRQVAEFGRLPDSLVKTGTPARDIIGFQARRGDFGPGDPDKQVAGAIAVMTTPGGVRYHRRVASGQYIEFNFKPLPGGQLLGYYRDLTEMKEIEEAVRTATDRLQIVIDNLPDGVMLFDKDRKWLMWNRQLAEFQKFPPDVARVGASAEEILLFQARRGDFGPGDPQVLAAERMATMWTPGGVRYSRRAASGRFIEFNFMPLPGGQLLGYYRDLTERKDAEDAVDQARARLQGAIEGLTSGFALYDSDDRLVIWNKRFEEFTPGIAGHLRVGARFEDIVRAAAEKGQFRDAVGNEEAWLRERLIYHQQPRGHIVNQLPDGRWVQLDKRRTASGDMVSVFTDITEIKKKEEEVTQATELLHDAIEALNSGFAIYDDDDRLVVWNRRYEELTPAIDGFRERGVRFEEMLRAAVAAGQAPADAKGREEEWLAERLSHHANPVDRIVSRLADGRWVHIEKQRTKANHVVSVFTDISDLKKSEEAVREAQTRLQDAIESLGSGFILCDSETRLIAWNSGLVDMLPRLADDLHVGLRFGDFVRAAVRRGALKSADMQSEEWIAERRASGPRRMSQTVVETSEGRWLHMTRRISANGNTVAILTDITEMKNREIELDQLVLALESARDAADKARDDAEAANQAKSTFLATMSHEIRTPMNGVLGMLEVLEHGDLGDRQRTQVGLARHSAMSLLNIIDDVLDFSKIEAGRLELEKVEIDLLSLVEGVAETMTEGARRKGLALYAEVDPLLPEIIIGDPTRLRQVLFNLVGNAIKFTEKGSVSIVAESLTRDGAAAMRLTVADTGIGMSSEQRARLFTPFEQADTTTTRRFGGTGLGLSIVARLVELMGGAVTAQSAPGHGSVFNVVIPVNAVTKRTPAPPPLAGVSVAVMMADTDAAKRLGGHLARAGASVHVLADNDHDETGPRRAPACDLFVAERGLAPVSGPTNGKSPPRRVYLDRWEAGPTGATERSVPMPWRIDAVIAAAAELSGRSVESAARSPVGPSDRWVHDMSDRLAARDGRRANGAGVEPAPVAPEPAGRGILIVDDHPVNREVIRRQLELLGHETDEAENGSAAFALWQAGHHRLVITDCHMPVLDGFGLTAAIRAAEEGGPRRTPIVALTANALAGEADRCLEAGMDDYLAKPVPLDKLRGAVERWLTSNGAPKQQGAARGAATAMKEVLLDRGVLVDLFGDDDATIARLMGTFIDTTQASLGDIGHAFDGGDVAAITDIAHRMKGSARMVGAQKLAEVAEAIEKAAKAGDVAAARAHQRNLQSAVEKTLGAAKG